MRTMTVRDCHKAVTYRGFRRVPDKGGHMPACLGVVLYEGEPETWSLDWTPGSRGEVEVSVSAVRELKLYYWEQHGVEVEVTVYEANRCF
jgi:hypothetical protein